MRNMGSGENLQRRFSREARRGAFSLVELVVAMGVLVMILTLAGQVLSLTVRSTGQAKALTDVNQRLRLLERTLREDLRSVDRRNSVLLLQGNPVNAYWTKDGQDADDDGDPRSGYPHPRDPEREREDPTTREMVLVRPRADILMIFSARDARSAVYPDRIADVGQIVYGHAALGEYVPSGGGGGAYDFAPGPEAFPLAGSYGPNVDPDIASLVPAAQWHLARRSVLLLPVAPLAGETSASEPGQPTILNGSTDLVAGFSYADRVLTPGFWDSREPMFFPWYFPSIFIGYVVPFERSVLDPTPPPGRTNASGDLVDPLGHSFLPNCASFKVEWTLDPRSEFVGGRLDGEKEIYWFDPGDLADPGDPTDEPDPLRTLRNAIEEAEDLGDIARANRLAALLEYPLGGRIETVDGRNYPETYTLSERFRAGSVWNDHRYSDADRPNLAVFCARRRSPSGVEMDEEIFPSALRITVDVYDDSGRLERPIRHVMILPVGW